MKGHIAPHGAGAWRLFIDAGRDPQTGRRKRVTRVVRGSRDHAENELAQLIVEVNAGHWTGPAVTFGELLDRWMAHASLGAKTRDDYDSVIRRHLKPTLGDMSLHKLRAHNLDTLYDQLLAAGLSPARIAKVHTVARSALRQAVRWRWIASSPAVDATPPSVSRPDIEPPDHAEVRRLLDHIEQRHPRLAAFVHVDAATGLRMGELCGLQWRDLDPATGTLTVRRSVSCPAGGLVVKQTKTGRWRTLAVDRWTLRRLDAWRVTCVEEALAWGVRIEPDSFVFHRAGQPDVPWRTDVAGHWFARARAEAGLARVRFHDLRHYVATTLIADGEDPVTVAGRLGHARVSTTLDMYAAFQPAKDRDAADRLGRRLNGG